MIITVNDKSVKNTYELNSALSSIKSKIRSIESVINDIKEDINQRYHISYMYGDKGISFLVRHNDIYATEDKLKDHLVELGVPNITESTIVNFSDAVLSYQIDEMKGEQLIITGDKIRYYEPAKKRSSHPSWVHLTSDIKVIIQKLESTKEDELFAETERFVKIFEKLQKEKLIDVNGELAV